jgi:CubicO group peptidase (beta-lactamase class C family)
VAGDRIRFAFPGGAGELRVRLARDGLIDGFWLQPQGGTTDSRDPGGAGQPFASPLALRASGRDGWSATVLPLKDRFTLYLKIFRGPDGALMAAFRNPESNSHGPANQLKVTEEGEAVHFTVGSDPAELKLDATHLSNPDRLQITWEDLNRKLELHRASTAEAAAFTPRPAGEPPYAYHRPPDLGDGWATARAADVGMDEEMLRKLVQRLIDTDPSIRRPGLIHSMLVARHGRLVLEEYFYGYGRDDPHDLRSAGKTYASVMLGAAMREGMPISPSSHVYEVMKGRGPFANPDPRKGQITLQHLLTHTSGLDCNDNDDKSLGNEGTMQTQTAQPDWWKYTLALPMAHDPGTRYAYCSASINLAGGAISTATGTWLPEYFDRHVARPLQFGRYYWNLQPNGEGYQGGGAFVRPRDFLKLGQAYLDGGVWHGRRIVDADWIRQSTAPLVKVSPETTGLTAEEFGNFYGPAEDGLAWHLSKVKLGERTYDDYAATGNGGQLLIVIPEFDMTVVFTAGNYMQGGIWSRFRSELAPNDIIGAIRR